MSEPITFEPKPIMVNDVPLQKEIHAEVLEELKRWSQHCGHYTMTQGIERYMKIRGFDTIVTSA